MIPEPHAALQGVATWRIQCHDFNVTYQIAECKNSIRHIENRFSPYLFFLFSQCSLGFGERQLSYRL